MKVKKILKERHFKAGYILRTELIDGAEFGGKDIEVTSAYTLSGDYIGDGKIAYRLCHKRGINPQKARSDHDNCSIGFSEKDQKWYGWSHRAIYGFQVGDTVSDGDCCATSGFTEDYLREHPEENKALPIGFTAKNLDDCKRMAIAFAASVS